MSKNFESVVIDIDWEHDAPPPSVRCPMTGEIVMHGYDPVTGAGPVDADEVDLSKVRTALFSYVDEIGFVYVSPGLQAKIEAAKAKLGSEADEWDDFDILVEHVEELGVSPVVFRLNTHGEAHGPVQSTVCVGLDLAASPTLGS